MKTSKFERAKILQSQIDFLQEEIKLFNPSNKFVHLNISDQYGIRQTGIIKTYALSSIYLEAAGYSFDTFISDAYSEFLEKVQTQMQERINMLRSEFNEL